ncbi:glycosyltransferase [Candidatus Cyanaurora vandensis]|uniref:glycosyltransferase n=1 Tax=Candidatus Cyanaurora vandensis TaxID=2714958 RepID=UPI00257A6A8B|nr:glycosyltransferase [Candidatus Cyanaurora vandensis]
MAKPTLTIFYQFDPWGNSLGGIQTTVRSYVKYAPPEFELRLVGIEDDPTVPTGVWHKAELAGRDLWFMPLFTVANDNYGRKIPITVQYTAALLKHDFSSDFLHFHRLEPTLAARSWQGEKTLFVHNDIAQQLNPQGREAILWQRFPKVYLALEGWLIQQFNEILSCNQAAVEHYRRHYPALAQRVHLQRNTVDQEVFSPLTPPARDAARRELAHKLELDGATRFLLFAGRLHPQKDPVLLVQSLQQLADPLVHLLIAGEGDLGAQVQAEISRLGLVGRVTMLGAIPQTELARLQRLVDGFVLSSVYEGLPLVALEALACGTPVVTTRAGETPNLLLPGSGLVVEERTPVALAQALRRVVHEPQAFPAAQCVKAAEPYSARAVIESVYRNMWQRWR